MSGLTDYAIEEILSGTPHPTTVYLQLHTGDPGVDGTSNVSTTPLRQPVTIAVGGAEGTNAEDASFVITAALETISHWSAFDADSGGHCWWVGTFENGRSLSAGDVVLVASGRVVFRIRRT